MPFRGADTGWCDLGEEGAQLGWGDGPILEHGVGYAAFAGDCSDEEVLRADLVVAQLSAGLLGEYYGAAGEVCESFEHHFSPCAPLLLAHATDGGVGGPWDGCKHSQAGRDSGHYKGSTQPVCVLCSLQRTAEVVVPAAVALALPSEVLCVTAMVALAPSVTTSS